jgi:hypothetical protein
MTAFWWSPTSPAREAPAHERLIRHRRTHRELRDGCAALSGHRWTRRARRRSPHTQSAPVSERVAQGSQVRGTTVAIRSERTLNLAYGVHECINEPVCRLIASFVEVVIDCAVDVSGGERPDTNDAWRHRRQVAVQTRSRSDSKYSVSAAGPDSDAAPSSSRLRSRSRSCSRRRRSRTNSWRSSCAPTTEIRTMSVRKGHVGWQRKRCLTWR